MIILIHSSKTMRPAAAEGGQGLPHPQLLPKAEELSEYCRELSTLEIGKVMQVSSSLAATTQTLLNNWSSEPRRQRPAVDSFLGDIYSGLQVGTWTRSDRDYAQSSLRILSGLYGILRPLDGIYPYRLEMGYRLPDPRFKNLYSYWGDAIARTLPDTEFIVNLAAAEYSKTVTDHIDHEQIITPSFLTTSPKTGKPTFVVVHAKIARGAFAAWLVKNRVEDISELPRFSELGYVYNAELSTKQAPVFICEEFGGLGLSVRLT